MLNNVTRVISAKILNTYEDFFFENSGIRRYFIVIRYKICDTFGRINKIINF